MKQKETNQGEKRLPLSESNLGPSLYETGFYRLRSWRDFSRAVLLASSRALAPAVGSTIAESALQTRSQLPRVLARANIMGEMCKPADKRILTCQSWRTFSGKFRNPCEVQQPGVWRRGKGRQLCIFSSRAPLVQATSFFLTVAVLSTFFKKGWQIF